MKMHALWYLAIVPSYSRENLLEFAQKCCSAYLILWVYDFHITKNTWNTYDGAWLLLLLTSR
jgi:hypothetical protein